MDEIRKYYAVKVDTIKKWFDKGIERKKGAGRKIKN